MIKIRAEIKGEADSAPFIKIFEFSDTDETIFLNTVSIIKQKISKNLKLNMNEVFTVYCSYLVSEIRSGRSVKIIEKNIREILTVNNVMIGVPESLANITLNVTIDDLPNIQIIFNEPIPIRNYILSSEKIGNVLVKRSD